MGHMDMDVLMSNGFHTFELAASQNMSELKALYAQHFSAKNGVGMSVTHNRGQAETNKNISAEIQRILGPNLKQVFPGFSYFVGHFTVKSKKCLHSFELHRDWDIVDESQHPGIQVWLPLDISYPENGGMCFVAGSQHFNPAPRSGSLDIPRIKIEEKLYPYLSYTRLLPGQAVGFLNNVFHGSFSNPTDDDRVSVLINLVPEGAQTRYTHLNLKKNCNELYALDADELFDHLPELEKGLMPLTRLLKEEPATAKQSTWTAETLIGHIKQYRAEQNLPADYEYKENRIIKDAAIERQINQNGYAVVQLLTQTEIDTLRTRFGSFFPNRSLFQGRYNSLDNLDEETRKEAHAFIAQAIRHQLDLFFDNYISPIGVFYGKRNDGVNDTDWHTDPSMVFNPQLESFYGVWCPLHAIDERHGVLRVVPGSHRLLNRLISPNFEWPLAQKRRLLDQFAKGFSLSAGQAIIFDVRLIHGSTPNISDRERECIVLRVCHRHTRFVSLAPSDEPDTVHIYAQSGDFFFGRGVHHHTETPDTGSLAGKMWVFPHPPVTEAEMTEKFTPNVRHSIQ